jgi:hypothetical protein
MHAAVFRHVVRSVAELLNGLPRVTCVRPATFIGSSLSANSRPQSLVFVRGFEPAACHVSAKHRDVIGTTASPRPSTRRGPPSPSPGRTPCQAAQSKTSPSIAISAPSPHGSMRCGKRAAGCRHNSWRTKAGASAASRSRTEAAANISWTATLESQDEVDQRSGDPDLRLGCHTRVNGQTQPNEGTGLGNDIAAERAVK